MKWSPARAARKGQVPCVSERLKGEVRHSLVRLHAGIQGVTN